MKKVLLTTTVIIGLSGLATSSVNAEGLYAGIQGGYSWMNIDNINDVGSGKIKDDNGETAEVNVGYLFHINDRFSLGPEIGIGTNFYSPKAQENSFLDTETAKLNTNYYIPVMFKVQFNMNNDLYLFGKAGVAYVSQTVKYSSDLGYSYKDTNNQWEAAFGAGVGYNIAQNVTLELSYNYIDGKDKNNDSDYDIFDETYRFQNVSLGVNYTF